MTDTQRQETVKKNEKTDTDKHTHTEGDARITRTCDERHESRKRGRQEQPSALIGTNAHKVDQRQRTAISPPPPLFMTTLPPHPVSQPSYGLGRKTRARPFSKPVYVCLRTCLRYLSTYVCLSFKTKPAAAYRHPTTHPTSQRPSVRLMNERTAVLWRPLLAYAPSVIFYSGAPQLQYTTRCGTAREGLLLFDL